METVYSKVKVVAQSDFSTTYRKVNSSIVLKGAMNSFNVMFPLARMFPVAVIHTHPSPSNLGGMMRSPKIRRKRGCEFFVKIWIDKKRAFTKKK